VHDHRAPGEGLSARAPDPATALVELLLADLRDGTAAVLDRSA